MNVNLLVALQSFSILVPTLSSFVTLSFFFFLLRFLPNLAN